MSRREPTAQDAGFPIRSSYCVVPHIFICLFRDCESKRDALRCLLLALSGHLFQGRECPLCFRFRNQHRRGRSLLPEKSFPVRSQKFPVLLSREFRPQSLGDARVPPCILNRFRRSIPCIFPQIREFDCRDRFAAASLHSHLVVAFLALFKPSPTARRAPTCPH